VKNSHYNKHAVGRPRCKVGTVLSSSSSSVHLDCSVNPLQSVDCPHSFIFPTL